MEPVDELACVLRENEVCVWSVGLEVNAARLSALEALLSADERERAGRFHFSEHRRRYIVARAHLRLLLGALCEVCTSAIRIFVRTARQALAAISRDRYLFQPFTFARTRALRLEQEAGFGH